MLTHSLGLEALFSRADRFARIRLVQPVDLPSGALGSMPGWGVSTAAFAFRVSTLRNSGNQVYAIHRPT